MADATNYTRVTATGAIKAGQGLLYGIIVNSHSSGTIKLWDSLSGANTVLMNTYTLPAGSQVIMFPVPINFVTGLYFTLGGTADITFLVN